MRKTFINGKLYTVEFVFNMVGNWHFTDKHGTIHLVDNEDVSEWADDNQIKWRGIETAVDYAKELAEENGGVFWWSTKNQKYG